MLQRRARCSRVAGAFAASCSLPCGLVMCGHLCAQLGLIRWVWSGTLHGVLTCVRGAQLAAAIITETQNTPLGPIVQDVVRVVAPALGGGSSLSAPSPSGRAIFNTNAAPAGAPAAARSGAPAAAPAVAATVAIASAPAVGRSVPVFATDSDVLSSGGRRMLRA